jgi:hypothetical protein
MTPTQATLARRIRKFLRIGYSQDKIILTRDGKATLDTEKTGSAITFEVDGDVLRFNITIEAQVIFGHIKGGNFHANIQFSGETLDPDEKLREAGQDFKVALDVMNVVRQANEDEAKDCSMVPIPGKGGYHFPAAKDLDTEEGR